MRIVSDERVARFVSEELNVSLCPPFTAMGIERHGNVVAGVIFNCFEGPDLHVTVAGTSWTKSFLAEVGHYVFATLKCRRMTALTASRDVVRIAERLGGKVEGCLRHHFPDGSDAHIVGILAEDYKF